MGCQFLPPGSDSGGLLEGRRGGPSEMLRSLQGGQALGAPSSAYPGKAVLQGLIRLQLALALWHLRGIINTAAHKRATCIYYVPHSLELTSNGCLMECWAPRRVQ